jgi:hypothetical protein
VKRFIVIMVVAACAQRSPPMVTANDAERANVELTELQQGRKLLVGKCASCHAVPLPAEHAAAEWPKLVADMAERSKLTTAQQKLIEQYLVTMATR